MKRRGRFGSPGSPRKPGSASADPEHGAAAGRQDRAAPPVDHPPPGARNATSPGRSATSRWISRSTPAGSDIRRARGAGRSPQSLWARRAPDATPGIHPERGHAAACPARTAAAALRRRSADPGPHATDILDPAAQPVSEGASASRWSRSVPSGSHSPDRTRSMSSGETWYPSMESEWYASVRKMSSTRARNLSRSRGRPGAGGKRSSTGTRKRKPTLSRYLRYLEATFLIQRLRRIDASGQRFQRANHFKAYLTTPSLRSALFGPVGPDDEAMGRLVETAVFAPHFAAGDELPLRPLAKPQQRGRSGLRPSRPRLETRPRRRGQMVGPPRTEAARTRRARSSRAPPPADVRHPDHEASRTRRWWRTRPRQPPHPPGELCTATGRRTETCDERLGVSACPTPVPASVESDTARNCVRFDSLPHVRSVKRGHVLRRVLERRTTVQRGSPPKRA